MGFKNSYQTPTCTFKTDEEQTATITYMLAPTQCAAVTPQSSLISEIPQL